MVSLRAVDDSNRQAVEALRVAPGQQRFVSSVADSLREAAEHPGAHAMPWAVYNDETPVGFVMIADEVDSSDYVPHYLWKLLIDERYQRRGLRHGDARPHRRLLPRAPGVEVLTTSAGQGEGSPIAFYERYGFERTGEASSTTRSCSGSGLPARGGRRRPSRRRRRTARARRAPRP